MNHISFVMFALILFLYKKTTNSQGGMRLSHYLHYFTKWKWRCNMLKCYVIIYQWFSFSFLVTLSTKTSMNWIHIQLYFFTRNAISGRTTLSYHHNYIPLKITLKSKFKIIFLPYKLTDLGNSMTITHQFRSTFSL